LSGDWEKETVNYKLEFHIEKMFFDAELEDTSSDTYQQFSETIRQLVSEYTEWTKK